MCFNRRRNIFTLGDFHQENNPTSQIRSQLKNRTKADPFERDPFKVQSFNFHYAERPLARSFPNPACPVHGCLNQQTRRLEQQPQRLTVTKPFDVDAFRYGLANPRQNESFTQASQFAEFRRRQQQSSLYPPYSTSEWPSPLQRQQYRNSTTRFANTSTDTVSQLSTYVGARQETTSSTGTSSTQSTRIPKAQYNANNVPTTRRPYSRYVQEQNSLVNETTTAAAARARSAEKGGSKTMAAAVGTVGSGALSTTTATGTKTSAAAAAAANRLWQQQQQLQKRNNESSTSIADGRSTSGCRRSSTMLENRVSASNTQMPNMGRGCSATSMQKRSATTLSRRHARQDSQTNLQYNQSKMNPTIQSHQCTSAGGQICINIKSLNRRPTNENLIIKIESDAPLRVVSNKNENRSHQPSQTSWRSKRLNNLMARKTTSNVPQSLNIRPKRSTDVLSNRNQQSSECSLNQGQRTLKQRRRACERFFEREDERMRQLAATSPIRTLTRNLSGVGYMLGRANSPERMPTRLPWLRRDVNRASSVDKDITRSTPSVQRVHCLYERGLKSNVPHTQSSKEHNPPPASKPLNRAPYGDENERLCAKFSTSTFTLDQHASAQTVSSASRLSMRSYSSNRSHDSESMQAIRRPLNATVAQT